MLKSLFLVFIGGGAGSILRYLTGAFIHKLAGNMFPYGTLAVNIGGSFLIGIFYVFFLKSVFNEDLRLLLIVGFCDGFTTFSTFSLESFELYKSGEIFHFILYIVASVILCLLFVWLGYFSGKHLAGFI